MYTPGGGRTLSLVDTGLITEYALLIYCTFNWSGDRWVCKNAMSVWNRDMVDLLIHWSLHCKLTSKCRDYFLKWTSGIHFRACLQSIYMRTCNEKESRYCDIRLPVFYIFYYYHSLGYHILSNRHRGEGGISLLSISFIRFRQEFQGHSLIPVLTSVVLRTLVHLHKSQ